MGPQWWILARSARGGWELGAIQVPFDGTKQLYGRAKLDIEAQARRFGACSVRPGLVYGRRAGGMAGTLQRLTRLPVVPLIGGRSYQFTVHEDDFADAIVALADAPAVPADPIGIANPVPVPFGQIMDRFARDQALGAISFPSIGASYRSSFRSGRKLHCVCLSGLTPCLVWLGLPRKYPTSRCCNLWGSACGGSANRYPPLDSLLATPTNEGETVASVGSRGQLTSMRAKSGWWSLPLPSPSP